MSPRPARRPKACGPPWRRRRPRCGPPMKRIRTSSGPQCWGVRMQSNAAPFVVSRYIVTHRLMGRLRSLADEVRSALIEGRAARAPCAQSAAAPAVGLLDRGQEGRLAALGRCADDEEAELVVVAIRELERGPRAGRRARCRARARAAPGRLPRPCGSSASPRARRRPPPAPGRCGVGRSRRAGSGRGSRASASSTPTAPPRGEGRPHGADATRARPSGRRCTAWADSRTATRPGETGRSARGCAGDELGVEVAHLVG